MSVLIHSNKKSAVAAYVKLLKAIKDELKDPIIYAGIREGLNKFVSNAYLKGKSKIDLGEYFSQGAIDKIKSGTTQGLIFEHIVPKHKYIQDPCVEMARNGELDEKEVEKRFTLWKIAIITKEENKKLRARSMPPGWEENGGDILARYKEAQIKLIPREELKIELPTKK